MNKKYRSLLFVPATEKMIMKINKYPADAVIVDLEDAVATDKKEEALNLLNTFFVGYSFDKDIFVRINPDRIVEETEILNKFSIKGYMLPKTESLEDVKKLSEYANGKKIIALIETPCGLINVDEIISSEFVHMTAFGAEDYTSMCGMKNSDEYLMYQKSKIVTYAKAYQKQVFDTISLNITDKEAFRCLVQSSKNFGFDGRLAIHPMQIDVINEVYADYDIEYYKKIVAEYDKCKNAVLNINGQVFEKPHIEAMRKMIKESEL